MMEEQVNVEEVLKNMRETIGALAQENAILKAQINQSTT
jgi:hypothetical protein